MHCFDAMIYFESSGTSGSDTDSFEECTYWGKEKKSASKEKERTKIHNHDLKFKKNKLPESLSAPLFNNFEKQLSPNTDTLYKNFERKLSLSTNDLLESQRIRDDQICKTLTPIMNRRNKKFSFLTGNKTELVNQEAPLKLSRSNPSIFRKPIDITSSKEYRDIYASNVRLYSVVIAKQMASLSQVGREMDDIRRNKIRQKALNGQEIADKRKASSLKKVLTSPISSNTPHINTAIRLAKCKKEHPPRDVFSKENPTKVTSEVLQVKQPSDNLCKTNETEGWDLLKPSNAVLKNDFQHNRYNRENEIKLSKSGTSRFKAAADRTEYLRKCLESFDNTVTLANTFLAKVKSKNMPE